jgi:AhpD family alkylhydroperoxidase
MFDLITTFADIILSSQVGTSIPGEAITMVMVNDIMATRKSDWINNFWKVLATCPSTLKRIWSSVKEVMAPGKLDPLTKEMIYVAVSVTNNCEYCIHSHTASARAKGMTDEMFAELQAVVGLANQTNRLANGYQIPVDEQFKVTF